VNGYALEIKEQSMRKVRIQMTVLLLVLIGFSQVMAQEPAQPEWTDISEPLFRMQYKDYDKIKESFIKNKWRYGSKTAAIAFNRMSGDLYASINNGAFYQSQDGGATWEKVEAAQVKGRSYVTGQIQMDPHRPGRYAVFRIAEANIRKKKNGHRSSGLTLDGGKTWISFNDPETDGRKDKEGNLKNVDAWTYGQVDWQDDQPRMIIAKQHHSSHTWASSDCGQTWKLVHRSLAWCGLGGNGALLVADPNNRAILMSTDLGESWTKTADHKVTTFQPVTFNNKVYWAGEKGIAVSEDHGKTWQLLDLPSKEAASSPYFGNDEDEMLIVNKDGFFVTKDRCKTWKNVAPMKIIEDAWNNGEGLGYYSFGWDWKSEVIYSGAVGGSIYRRSYLKGGEK
jgi:hypothetical protein